MDEKYINNLIRKSMDWGYKISDQSMDKKPYDLFGLFRGNALYIETKYLSTPEAFNFKRLADHQISSLLEASKQNIENIIPLLLIAVNYGRNDIRVFYYKDMDMINRRKQNKNNILKKEFDSSTNYVTIKKSLINMDEIIGD